MNTITVVVVLGRPSANTQEFFNSIKFWTYESDMLTTAGALRHNDPASRPDYEEKRSGGYQVLNWFAFNKEGKE